jgi:hypothetical protein
LCAVHPRNGSCRAPPGVVQPDAPSASYPLLLRCPLFQAVNACGAAVGALSGPYFKMSGLIPPALAIAYAVFVGRRGAPYVFTSFANVVMTSARLSTDLRAIRALGQRMKRLEKKMDSGFAAAVEKLFVEMGRNVDKRSMSATPGRPVAINYSELVK